MKYTLQHIATIVGGKLIGPPAEKEILYLVIDSRKIVFPDSSLFIAIKGPQHDGHQYINQVNEAGVHCFIISDEKTMVNAKSTSSFVLVDDTLQALQKLASYHRQQFTIPIIGVTGSNGKTVVKDWLSQVLSVQFNVCKNPKSYNSQVGVPLSVWNLHSENEIGIFEAGISQKDEMDRLEAILNPTIGIFTNIGAAHEENFTDIRDKIREKLILFKDSETIIFRNDLAILDEEIKKIYSKKKLITWGNSDTSLFHFRFLKTNAKTEIFLTNGDENYSFFIPFVDLASIENAVNVFLTALTVKADMTVVAEQMKFLPQINMRLSFKTGKNNCYLIDDTYSNDFDSLRIAIDSLSSLHQYPKKSIILSDIAQSKTNRCATV